MFGEKFLHLPCRDENPSIHSPAALRRLSADGGRGARCFAFLRMPLVARPFGTVLHPPWMRRFRGSRTPPDGSLLLGSPLYGDRTLPRPVRRHRQVPAMRRNRPAAGPLCGRHRPDPVSFRQTGIRRTACTSCLRSRGFVSGIPGTSRAGLIFAAGFRKEAGMPMCETASRFPFTDLSSPTVIRRRMN